MRTAFPPQEVFWMHEHDVQEFKCADLGKDCPYQVRAGSLEELMANISGHAARVHDIRTIDPELQKAVMEAIRKV